MEYDPESPHDHSPSSGSLPHRGRFGSRRRSTAPFIRRSGEAGSESEANNDVIEDSAEDENADEDDDEEETTPGQTQLTSSHSPTEIFRSDFVLDTSHQADSMSRVNDLKLSGAPPPSFPTSKLMRSPMPGLLTLTGRSTSSNASPTTPRPQRPREIVEDESVAPDEDTPLLANEQTPLLKGSTSPWPSRRSSMAISYPDPGPGSRSRRQSPSAPRKASLAGLLPPGTRKPRRKSELEILRGERGISTEGQTVRRWRRPLPISG